jgi:hypothetical protein
MVVKATIRIFNAKRFNAKRFNAKSIPIRDPHETSETPITRDLLVTWLNDKVRC